MKRFYTALFTLTVLTLSGSVAFACGMDKAKSGGESAHAPAETVEEVKA